MRSRDDLKGTTWRAAVSGLAQAGVGALTAAVLLLQGCATPPSRNDGAAQVVLPADYRNAAVRPMQGETRNPGAGAGETATSSEAAQRDAYGNWWRVFANPELDRLVDQALANNRDLRIATLQLAQAKLRADQVDADGKPRLSAPLQAALQAPGGQVGAVPVSRSSSRPQTSYQASLQGMWQPDIWGERQGMAESAEFQIWRAVHERENVQRNLIGNLVTAYVNYLMANDSVSLARDSEETERRIVKVLEQRLAAGDATADEMEQKRAALYTLQMALPGLELQREEARNNIALLAGSVPGELDLADAGLDSLTRPEIVAGLPSSLLFQRPDIRAVEARMKSANADIGVARARLMPALNLSSQLGYSGLGILQLLQPQNLFWNLISGMTVSIFDGGRKQADRALSQANYEEMVETYARTVLQAVREVEGALAGLRSSRGLLVSQQKLTSAGRNLYQISDAGFSVGATDSTSLLEARKNYQRFLEDEQRRKGDYLKSHVTLYQALGAGVGAMSADESGDLSGLAGAEIFTGGRSGLAAIGGWQVALAGVHHQSTVAAVWRDLNARYPAEMRGHALRVRLNGRIETPDGKPEAWHQLAVTRFSGKEDAERFCRVLRGKQQQCGVEASDPAELAAAVARPVAARRGESAGGR